ncbi:MAG: hypothetical protein AB1351_02555 [Thermoproteota archaeon]
MNSTDRHEDRRLKTIAVTGIGLLLMATAFALSVGGSGYIATAQQTEQQQNQTQGQNATTIANTTVTDTFTAKGVITGTIQQGGEGQTSMASNQTNATQSNATQPNATQTAGAPSAPFLVGGDWNIDAEAGNVTTFRANFTMVRTDGSDHHSMDISNFRVGNNTQFQLDPAAKSTINGTADFAVNGTTTWPGIDTTITIEKARIMTIQPQEEEAMQHFQGQPIYGIVLTATGANGTKITETAPAGGNQTQQEDGGILEQLRRPFEDLFGG